MRIQVLILSLGMLAAWSAAPEVAVAEPQLSDQAISDQVEDELLFDAAVLSANIDVETIDGIVTLTGSVNNILAKERSARLAQAVKGVRAVVNRVEVTPSTERTDEEIANDIEAAWLNDPATESYEASVSVNDGVATVTGTVDSWLEKQLVATVAKGVRGVTDVKNQVMMRLAPERPDSEIQREIEQALRWNTYLDFATAVDVQVDDGVVTLSGTVGSVGEQNTAIQLAWVNGVKDVDSDHLQIRDWLQDPDRRDSSHPVVSDSEIEQAVKDALLYDPRVKSFNVDVEARFGQVTLRGEVDNLKAKSAAANTAQNTYGVSMVNNRLKVRSPDQPSDDELERRIRDALLRDPYTDSYDVTVAVSNGIADLFGTVDTYFERSQAEDVASRIKGVTMVDNNLVVQPGDEPYVFDPFVDTYYPYSYHWYGNRYEHLSAEKSDVEIKEDIQDELWWSPFVDADQVIVSVNDGTATLTGQVDSIHEKRAAAENAIEGGATSVTNNLTVEF